MDIVASIVGYLGAVTGIIVAIAVSYNAVVSKPLDVPHAPTSTHVASRAVASSKPPKAKTRRAGEERRGGDLFDKSVVTAAGTRGEAERQGRQRSRHLANEPFRRHFARSRQYATRVQTRMPSGFVYQSEPRRAPYALGYAQAPREPFGDGSYE